MRISIVIATYNRAGSLKSAIESIVHQSTDDKLSFELIVVDNNSSDNTKDVVLRFEEKYPGLVKYLFEPKQGKRFAVNAGIRAAQGEIISLTDDDCIVDEDWLVAVDRAFRNEDVSFVGGKTRFSYSGKIPSWFDENYFSSVVVNYDLGDKFKEIQSPRFAGANLHVRKSALEAVNMFDFSVVEDSHLCYKLIKEGYRGYYSPSIQVAHCFTDDRMNQDYFRQYYFDRGYLSNYMREHAEGVLVTRKSRLPLWVIRDWFVHLGGQLVSTVKGNSARAFYHKTRAAFSLGCMRFFLNRPTGNIKKLLKRDGGEEKILFICSTFPPVLGGIETFYHQLTTGLGSKVTVLTENHEKAEEFDSTLNFPVIRRQLRVGCEAKSKISRKLAAWYEVFLVKRAVREAMRNEEFDLVIVGDGWLSWLAPFLKKEFKVRSTGFFHGKEIARMKKYGSKELLAAIRSHDFVMVISEFTRELVISAGVEPQKIRKVHPGVDATRFTPQQDQTFLRERLNLNGNRILLSICRLAERKGIQNVIDAMPEVLKQYPDMTYVVGGGGPMSDLLKQKVKDKGLENSVVFAGRLSDEDLPKAYNSADVVILPNLYLKESEDAEGFGIVFLEANACRKPVIGGDNGGTKDSVVHGETGYLVDPDNKESLTSTIVSLIKDPKKCEEFGNKGYERVHREFTWEAVNGKFQECLKN